MVFMGLIQDEPIPTKMKRPIQCKDKILFLLNKIFMYYVFYPIVSLTFVIHVNYLHQVDSLPVRYLTYIKKNKEYLKKRIYKSRLFTIKKK